MALYECSCGMVVSTPAGVTRCIRCGTVLNADRRLTVTTFAEGTAAVRDVCGMTPSVKAKTAPDHDERTVLATYVSLIVIAAARELSGRGENAARAAS